MTVAPEWNDWLVFYEWAKENGWKPGLTIDRTDNTKGYYPNNCRWVSRKENNRNRRCVNYYDWNGEKLTLGQIAEKEGFNRRDIDRARNRIKNMAILYTMRFIKKTEINYIHQKVCFVCLNHK